MTDPTHHVSELPGTDTAPAVRAGELGETAELVSDDRWGFRAKRQQFLDRFGAHDTAVREEMELALSDLTDALLREARYHATWPVATAEQWRYDRMLWVFGVMLGEIPADQAAPGPP